MNLTSPADCPAWNKLAAHAAQCREVRLADVLARDPGRRERMSAQAPGLRFDHARQRLDARALELLIELAAERGLAQWRDALLAGEPVNTTEGRAAWHTALRAGEQAPAEVKAALARMQTLAEELRRGRRIRRVVHLGVGGSALGPQLLADALGDDRLELRFAASSDPLELERALAGAEPERTLFVVVSKTFTTAETMANAHAAKRWGGKTFYAVTQNLEAARSFGAGEVLPMWNWVGGRFSVWSAAGFSAMLALGADRFCELLAGAREMDRHFASAPPQDNVPVLMALIGVWNVNFLGAPTHVVLPYAHALRQLPAYLQQLEMESNGKSVDRAGRALGYASAPVLWGMEGPPSEHSFHQLLHQGTQLVPADFIVAGVSRELDASAEAQAEALAHGTTDAALPPHRRHAGNRPSSTLRLDRLDARCLGALLAAYEHKVFTQGVVWNLNSFDQWGVELGKRLAREILSRRP